MNKVTSLAERRGRKQREGEPVCAFCGRPAAGGSVRLCPTCRAVEALCGYDVGLAFEIVERLGPDLAAELVRRAAPAANRA